jgi:thioredoxin 1
MADTDQTAQTWSQLPRKQQWTVVVSAGVRLVLALAALTLLYAVAPVDAETSATVLTTMVAATAVFAGVLVWQVRALTRSPYPFLRVVHTISVALGVFIFGFATVYLAMSVDNPAAFTEPLTKVSAVYFTVTVLSTVGFGDVAATNDVARLVVTAQMLLGLTFIAVVARFLVGYTQRRPQAAWKADRGRLTRLAGQAPAAASRASGIPQGVSWFTGPGPRKALACPTGQHHRSEDPMPTMNLTADNLSSTIEEHDIVLIDWWAQWCGPCKMFAPVFEQAAAEHPDIVFAKVDTEANQQLAGAAGIMSIPTLMAFREQVLVFSQPGALPAASLADLIAKVRELDMDEVHAAVAAQSASDA